MDFVKRGAFKADPELNRQLVSLENAVDKALKQLDESKADRFSVHTSSEASVQARVNQLWLLETKAHAVALFLPKTTVPDQKVLAVRLSAAFALTVYAVSATIEGAASHAPATGVLVTYVFDGTDWRIA